LTDVKNGGITFKESDIEKWIKRKN
jgi:hypothetical protein